MISTLKGDALWHYVNCAKGEGKYLVQWSTEVGGTLRTALRVVVMAVSLAQSAMAQVNGLTTMIKILRYLVLK